MVLRWCLLIQVYQTEYHYHFRLSEGGPVFHTEPSQFPSILGNASMTQWLESGWEVVGHHLVRLAPWLVQLRLQWNLLFKSWKLYEKCESWLLNWLNYTAIAMETLCFDNLYTFVMAVNIDNIKSVDGYGFIGVKNLIFLRRTTHQVIWRPLEKQGLRGLMQGQVSRNPFWTRCLTNKNRSLAIWSHVGRVRQHPAESRGFSPGFLPQGKTWQGGLG